jgi:hypothetical protein
MWVLQILEKGWPLQKLLGMVRSAGTGPSCEKRRGSKSDPRTRRSRRLAVRMKKRRLDVPANLSALCGPALGSLDRTHLAEHPSTPRAERPRVSLATNSTIHTWGQQRLGFNGGKSDAELKRRAFSIWSHAQSSGCKVILSVWAESCFMIWRKCCVLLVMLRCFRVHEVHTLYQAVIFRLANTMYWFSSCL